MLTIRLLGEYAIQRDGNKVVLSSHACQLLLAYLSVYENRKHPREILLELFWRDASPNIGRKYLRKALVSLRKSLGLDPISGAEYILSDRNWVWVNQAAGFQTDLPAIKKTLPNPPQIEDLAQDLEAYSGDFLPGFSEDWVLLERAQLKATYNRKIELLIDLLVNEKRWTEVLMWSERWIALEKTPEAAFRAAMIAHASQGDMTAVTRTYDRCVQVLLDESGIPPSELTSRTYHHLIMNAESRPPSRVQELETGRDRSPEDSRNEPILANVETQQQSFSALLPVDSLVNNRYRLDQLLGSGFMGVVYKAFDVLLSRPVAIKMLRRERLGIDGYSRLIQEAQTIAKINHPNIVTIFDAGEVDGIPYMVIELLDGELLTAHIPKPMDEVCRILLQICDALKQVHSHGIVHRDLKPENVIILKDGAIKLMDFGLAHYDTSRMTREGEILGTVQYLSPEQAMGKAVDPRTDIYALGILTYELVTGVLPFQGDNMVTVITQQLYASPARPNEINPSVTQDFSQLILKMMAKSPVDRPASIHMLVEELKSVQTGGDRKHGRDILAAESSSLPAQPIPVESTRERSLTDSGIYKLLANWRNQGVESIDVAGLALVHGSPPDTLFDQDDLLLLVRSVLHRQLDLEPWLARAGSKEKAVGVLETLLDEYPRPEIRLKIVRGLEGIGIQPACELLLRIATTDDTPAVRTEAALATARLGMRDQVIAGLLNDLSTENDLAAMAAFVAVVDEYGMPREATGYPKLSLSFYLLQRRLKLKGKLVWRQGLRCAFGGGVFLALNGLAAPFLIALSDPAQFSETVQFLTVPAWMIISALGLLILGLLQGWASGVLVGFGDAVSSPQTRLISRTILGATSGLVMALYVVLFTAIGAAAPISQPGIYFPVYIVYGLSMGAIISMVIPPLVVVSKVRRRALRATAAALAASLLTVPFVYLVYQDQASEYLLSRILLSVMLVLGIAVSVRNRGWIQG